MHDRFSGLLVKAGACIGDVIAGQYDALFDEQRLAVAVDKEFGAERYLALGCVVQGHGIALFFIHHADFQRGGAAENFLGLGGVLHARQLDDNAVGALLLDDRFRDSQFIDAVM